MDYLNDKQKEELTRTLEKFLKLFSGELGTLDIDPVHIELKPGAVPFHSRAYPVPKAYENPTRKESRRFCDIGVFKEANESQWAAPTFIQPKKTGDIRVLTDFRELNKWIVRRPYPLPQKLSYSTGQALAEALYQYSSMGKVQSITASGTSARDRVAVFAACWIPMTDLEIFHRVPCLGHAADCIDLRVDDQIRREKTRDRSIVCC